jgi:ATP adenylyltransferase/5',5'''-P-1,P-4-tetraphosphate phosphorylase II
MKILSDDQLILNLVKENNYSDAAKRLFEIQKEQWSMLKSGFKSLDTVRSKSFQFDGYRIKAQFNAGRMTSTSAKVDPKSISERKCFLCVENLPAEQKGILYKNDYIILCNPFPIFPEHFTLTYNEHTPQRILDTFSDMLDLSKDLSKHYSFIYNGPRCGASAPDHLHFQAGNKFFMTIDDEFHQIKNEYGKVIYEDDDLSFYAIDDGARKFVSIESLDKELVVNTFNKFYKTYSELMNEEQEPMINIVSFYEEEYGWRIIIFLRAKHRPAVFFAEDESKMLVSPAAIDLGGVCVFPREEDFNRITKEMIVDIFKEVFVDEDVLKKLINNFNLKFL